MGRREGGWKRGMERKSQEFEGKEGENDSIECIVHAVAHAINSSLGNRPGAVAVVVTWAGILSAMLGYITFLHTWLFAQLLAVEFVVKEIKGTFSTDHPAFLIKMGG